MYELSRGQSVKLGLFVTIGLALFLSGFFLIGKVNDIFSKSLELHVRFKDANGLQNGNKVILSGVKIGTVKEVKLTEQSFVLVSLKVDSHTQRLISKDTEIFISSEGFIGNKVLILEPGDSKQMIENGDTLQTSVLGETRDITTTLAESGKSITSLVAELESLIKNIQHGEGLIGKLITDPNLVAQVESSLADIEQTTNNARLLSDRINSMVNLAMKNEEGLIATLINDTSFSSTYQQSLNDFQATTQNLTQLSAELRESLKKIEQTDNVVGVLLSDSVFANNLKITMQQAAEGSKLLKEDAEALQHNFLFRRYFKKKAKEEAAAKDPK